MQLQAHTKPERECPSVGPGLPVSIGEVHGISLAEKCLSRQNATKAGDTKSLWGVRLASRSTK